jgi:hypothetical protein
MMKKPTRIILSVLFFAMLVAGYEYYIYLWSQNEKTVIIRVDVFLIYPLIFAVSALVYYLLGKIKNTNKT